MVSSVFLAMAHRPEVARVIDHRYGSVQDQVESALRMYDAGLFLKPTPEEEAECLSGATFVDVTDAFNINKRFFSRGYLLLIAFNSDFYI